MLPQYSNGGIISQEKLIAYCGLACDECPAFKAFAANDEELRKKAAKEWSEIYKADIKPEDINCTGCTSEDGIKFRHCFECKIRSCCKAHDLENCTHCDDYACDLISGFLEAVPEAKENLGSIRKDMEEP